MIVIPHTHQWMYNIHFGTPLADYQDFYVTVVLQQRYKSGLKLNGVLIPSANFTITPRCKYGPDKLSTRVLLPQWQKELGRHWQNPKAPVNFVIFECVEQVSPCIHLNYGFVHVVLVKFRLMLK